MPAKKKIIKKKAPSCTIIIKGEKFTCATKDCTKGHLIDLVRKQGIGKFSLRINKKEIPAPRNFPKRVLKDSVIEVIPYDEWG